MPYPEQFVAPMREELTRFGVEELRTAPADQALTEEQIKNLKALGYLQ